MPIFNPKTMEIENLLPDLNEVVASMPDNVGERISNSILYGDPRGFGYSHPTGKEHFEAAQKKKNHD